MRRGQQGDSRETGGGIFVKCESLRFPACSVGRDANTFEAYRKELL